MLSRRIYNAMSNVKKSYYLIRVSKNLKADLLVWSQFLEKFGTFRRSQTTEKISIRRLHTSVFPSPANRKSSR
jgi:hypothetical protein